MIFWIFVILLIVGVLVTIYGDYHWEDIGSFVVTISGIITAVLLLIIMVNYVTLDADLEKQRETYKAIVYKIESDACKDEFGLLSKEVLDEVQEWNETIIYRQNAQDNFWVGIFIPNVYDEFELIDYEKFKK